MRLSEIVGLVAATTKITVVWKIVPCSLVGNTDVSMDVCLIQGWKCALKIQTERFSEKSVMMYPTF
jgi:hypothetical protein